MSNPRVVETKELEVELYQGTLDERLATLAQLCAQLGPKPRRGTNCHIHTSESFSVFRSPTEAVWQAAREGVAVLRPALIVHTARKLAELRGESLEEISRATTENFSRGLLAGRDPI